MSVRALHSDRHYPVIFNRLLRPKQGFPDGRPPREPALSIAVYEPFQLSPSLVPPQVFSFAASPRVGARCFGVSDLPPQQSCARMRPEIILLGASRSPVQSFKRPRYSRRVSPAHIPSRHHWRRFRAIRKRRSDVGAGPLHRSMNLPDLPPGRGLVFGGPIR